jgi:hypothetical protein
MSSPVTVRDSSAVWPIASGPPGQQEFMVVSLPSQSTGTADTEMTRHINGCADAVIEGEPVGHRVWGHARARG